MDILTSLSFWYFAMLKGFWEHCKLTSTVIRWGEWEENGKGKCKRWGSLSFWLTSMMAACTLGFWNAKATSGFAMIFEITSSGVSPICSVIPVNAGKERSQQIEEGVMMKKWQLDAETMMNAQAFSSKGVELMHAQLRLTKKPRKPDHKQSIRTRVDWWNFKSVFEKKVESVSSLK